MGKNKKTRWRTFSFNGTKAEDDTHIANSKLNDTDTQNSSETPHKYSQVLGNHPKNFISPISNRNTSIHNSKTRNSFNNKENYYNQRSAAKNSLSSKYNFGSQRRYQLNGLALKDNKENECENGMPENKDNADYTDQPLKFNEDEYTRITTPRQDVLFKKGYLSRMNNNSNNNNKSTTSPAIISEIESAVPSTLTTTNSDQESNVSVSTLSPATTPSMDYGQQVDGMDYTTPLYYPGYYCDENGMLVIPMYNGYNYYSNGSSSTSPVYLMPYPYQYDPFFMAPNTEVPVSSDKTSSDQKRDDSAESVESNEKSESEKATNEISEEQNGSRTQNEEATRNNSNQCEDTESNLKDESSPNEQSSSKQYFPFYQNEYGYMYPTYSNGLYNGLYYYQNGMPSNRPSKLKRRKRFISARNLHPSRSTETTTDYSDDDGNSSYVYKRYNPSRHHNGWIYHHNNHFNNQCNPKYNIHKMNTDKNANEHSNLNVDVPEFFPCVINKSDSEEKKSSIQSDVPANIDQNQNGNIANIKSDILIKNIKASSKTQNGRVSKKDLIEGIKSMEQQNIYLMSSSKSQSSNNIKVDDEWNVIKNGKKIKVSVEVNEDKSDNFDKEEIAMKDNKQTEIIVKDDIMIQIPLEKTNTITKITQQPQLQHKSAVQATNNTKSKKSKSKNKKKKNHFLVKQDGFKIIEPDFGINCNKKLEEISNETSDDDTLAEDSMAEVPNEKLLDECYECEMSNAENIIKKNDCEILTIVSTENISLEPLKEEVQEAEEIIFKVLNVESSNTPQTEKNDTIIDISAEDILSRTNIEIDLSIAQEIVDEIKEDKDSKPDCIVEDGYVENEKKIDQLGFFEIHKDIAELERDLMENLKILDDGIDIKSPIINPLYDFPITSAVQKWLHERQNESFESLFRLENFKKLSELYDDCENEDDNKSDISDSPNKSETTDSDYASDIQVKVNGSPASSNAKIDTKITSKCNNKIIVKESFCALM